MPPVVSISEVDNALGELERLPRAAERGQHVEVPAADAEPGIGGLLPHGHVVRDAVDAAEHLHGLGAEVGALDGPLGDDPVYVVFSGDHALNYSLLKSNLLVSYLLMRDIRIILSTAIAPTLWGTTYLVTTEFLPANRPLLAAAVRALPAGILLIATVAALAGRAALPRRAWWWRSALLGTLNIGLFFALLFIGAYRLPGGVAAVLGAVGPFVVAAFAFLLLRERPGGRALLGALIGVAGVALLVLRSTIALDPLGLAAAAGGMLVMSLGTVLGRRWGTPEGFANRGTALLALTGWQLTAGGLVLLPFVFAIEGAPRP